MAHSFSEWLIRVRESRGLSQNALAQKANVDASLLSKYEKGDEGAPVPRRTTISKIAVALGLSDEEAQRGVIAAGYQPSRTAVAPVATNPDLVGMIESLPEEDKQFVTKIVENLATQPKPTGRVPFLRVDLAAADHEEEEGAKLTTNGGGKSR